MSLPWRVEMFGGLRVIQSDRTITRFQTQKTGMLLAYLALNMEQAHLREVMAELLWPGADPGAVRNRLNQAVSSLRRQLEPPEVGFGSVLITDQRSIRIHPDAVETDVDEFIRRIHSAEKTKSAVESQSFLARAVALYNGEFMSGFYADWITLEQLRFADLYSTALYDLLESSREVGDLDQAIRAAGLLIKADPTDEGAHCDLMRLYLDVGRPAAAKRQFEELSRILGAEEDEPSDEAYELNREACSVRGKASKSAAITMPVSPPSMDAPNELPPNLPNPTSRFVGRESELAKLAALIGDPQIKLVTILGLGGCGKTRLALQVAHELRIEFANRVYFVALAAATDASQIEEYIANAIGIREPEHLIRHLRQNERTLIVIDNLEHVVEEGALVVQRLLTDVRGLTVLATSRSPLKVDAERCFPLTPLPLPGADASIDVLSKNPSVAMFVDRAQAALPDFQLTPRNAAVIGEVCVHLEGLPLAIELAASWAKTVAPSQMLAMLGHRFSLLESRRRDISARHRTMRAVIDSSFSLLSDDIKTLFSRLAVFRDGWSLEAAAQVCQRSNILTGMESLDEASLILTDDAHGDTMRFRMLEILRDYAFEHLPAADQAESENLHAEYYSNLADKASDHLMLNDQGIWISRLYQESANLLSAFQWHLTHGLFDHALRMCNSMSVYWELSGRVREGRNWLERALAASSEGPNVDHLLAATATNNLARLIWVSGNYEEAARMHGGALEKCLEIGDDRAILFAQLNIQMEAHRTRDYDRSLDLLRDALGRAERLGDKYLQARCWLARGNTCVELRRLDEARHDYEQSLKIARSVDNKQRIASALNNLGNLASLAGQPDLARHHLTEAADLLDQIGATSLLTEAFLQLAKVARKTNDTEEALAWIRNAWNNHPEENYHVQAVFLEQAFAASARMDFGLAATFLGFVERQSEEFGALNLDIERQSTDELLARVRQGLSEADFSSARNLGRDLQLNQAAAMMLR